MHSFTFFIFCLQAFLVYNVHSQCIGAAGLGNAYGYGAGFAPAGAIAAPGAYSLGVAPIAEFPAAIEIGAYGGAGIGEVVVAGEMPVIGSTLVAGQVPILGAVRFAGDLPAAGTVSITGSCGCGGGALVY